MDIQREEFELTFQKTSFCKNMVKSLENSDCPFTSVFEMRNGKYRSSYVQLSFEIWQAAKAQAVPEGFVLVPKDRLTKAVDGIEALFEEDCTLALGQLLPIQQDLNAMIEAQEPAND